MKLKDLKPGMKVAIGNKRSIEARYGSWMCDSKYAIVVATGKYAKLNYADWRSSKPSFYENPRNKMAVLVAIINRMSRFDDGSDIWEPDVVGAQNILCTWEEREKNVQEEREAREKVKVEKKELVDKTISDKKRITTALKDILEEDMEGASVSVSSRGDVTISLQLFDKLLEAYNDS